MSEKDRFNVYLETSTVDDAKELDEFESFSSLVQTLVSAYLRGEIDVENDGTQPVHNDSTQGSELDELRERVSDAEDRLDAFENKGQPLLEDLVVTVNKLEDRVETLEEMAR